MSKGLKRIDELAQLKNDWCDDTSHAPNAVSIVNAKSVVKTLDTYGISYHIYPMYEGGIQFEFDAINEIQCLNDGKIIGEQDGIDLLSGSSIQIIKD